MLQPVIRGTFGILRSVKEYAPSVKRVVITSSFAAIINFGRHPAVYSEKVWNPMTYEEGLNPTITYPASKKLAEKAAWDFMEKEKPSFSLTTICPPLVYGPVIHQMDSLRDINTSNIKIRDFIQGKYKDEIPSTMLYLWVDVRDVAHAHIQALSAAGAENERFLVTAGHYDNKQIVDIIREEYPQFTELLPPKDLPGDLPEDIYQYDNSKSVNVLGLRYHTLRESIKDTVASLLNIEK
jgi:Nucleoside-diphosphate-sugar epimerases